MSKVIDFDKANNKSKSRDIRKNTEYFIGLDIGTSSVGWAVTNTKYEVIKFNGKKMWGSRLFAEASTAEDRRVHRTNRRRLQRRVDRINLLEEIFSEEMSKVDPEFFIRLKESKFHLEDKVIDEKNIIFKEKEDGDKKFYEKYPTIYHLRHALIEGCDDIDIRELYMAVHHIIKYRGHFLFKGDISDSGSSINDKIVEIIDLMSSVAGMKRLEYNDKLINEIRNIVSNRDKTINDKKKDINKVFGGNDYKAYKSIFALSVGAKVKPYDIFLEEEYKDLEDVKDILFKNTEYEEVRDTYEQAFEDRIILIDAAKSLYDMIVLLSIKPEGKGLSENKVDIYNKHHEDLEILKEVLRKDKDLYNRVLRDDKKDGTNYVNYIKKSKYGKGCSREDFYKLVKKALGELESNEKIEYILSEMELERFLSLQRLKENSVIPYQVHRDELKKILDNASSKFEFLNKESEGYSNIEKIIKLMEFRIPYYVGPLNNYHSVDNKEKQGFSWVVRKGQGRVKPWNFDQLVDKEASAEKFIENLTNKCTYLIGEDVLPKESLLYSEYCLLNELNNIMYDGKKLSLEAKNDLIEKVYKKEKRKMTKKGIKDFLKQNRYADGKGEVTGIDIDIKSDLKSYRDMVKIFGAGFNHKMAEDIIRWVTLFGESKELLLSKVKNSYGNMVDAKQLKMITKLRYKDWGKFSGKFLTEIRSDVLIDQSTGQGQSIIEAMRTRDHILMELLRNEYDFSKKVEYINREKQKNISEISHDLLDDLYCSPAVKRSLWQTICIVEEIKKIMGHEPKKIFVEVTRTNKAEKKRADSRKKRLLELYKNIQNDARSWIDEIEKTEDSKFNSKKLYLYYTQMGKCMYTGNSIDIESLFTDMYDIDHIFPRSKTKDNSFENLVLVTRKANEDKGDIYPVDSSIQNGRLSLWRSLHENKLIGDKKFERLTRNYGFTDEELSRFIARQLVETSQASKAAAEMLNMINEGSEIVYVKAENVSEFRHDNEFIKVREVNDHHHAKDAYLNIVVGNVYNEKFTKNPYNFIKDGGRKYSLNKVFDFAFSKGGKTIWDPAVSMDTVNRMMRSNNDVRVTKKVIEQKGALYDATVYKAGIAKEESYFPLKLGDERLRNVTKYGGYKSIKPAYFTIVSYDEVGSKKNKHIIRMVPIPIYVSISDNGLLDIEKYTYEYVTSRSKKSIENFKVIYNKLCKNALIEINGFKYYVGGKTDDGFYIYSGSSLILDEENNMLFGKVAKFCNADFKRGSEKFINFENNMKLYNCLIIKRDLPYYKNSKLYKLDKLRKQTTIDNFKNLSLEEQCGVLLKVLNILTNKSYINNKDLEKIKEKVSHPKTSMILSSYESFKVINQSITGLFENEIDILG
jgi:CRISPR-associated protein, csn1 family